jgi:hypothetical protein
VVFPPARISSLFHQYPFLIITVSSIRLPSMCSPRSRLTNNPLASITVQDKMSLVRDLEDLNPEARTKANAATAPSQLESKLVQRIDSIRATLKDSFEGQQREHVKLVKRFHGEYEDRRKKKETFIKEHDEIVSKPSEVSQQLGTHDLLLKRQSSSRTRKSIFSLRRLKIRMTLQRLREKAPPRKKRKL